MLQLGLPDPERHFGTSVAAGHGRQARTAFSSAHYHIRFVLFGLSRSHVLEDFKADTILLDLSWPVLDQLFFPLLLAPIPNETADNAWTVLIYRDVQQMTSGLLSKVGI